MATPRKIRSPEEIRARLECLKLAKREGMVNQTPESIIKDAEIYLEWLATAKRGRPPRQTVTLAS